MKHKLTMALPKGRILTKAVDFLCSAGIVLDKQSLADRKLIIGTSQRNLYVTLVRNIDAPVYTTLGVADVAIIGRDSITEEHSVTGFYDLLDLGIARCSLMTAARDGYVRNKRTIRVATKFGYNARCHYASLGIQAEIVRLYGSVELAAAIDLADEIVDLVETGKTLKDNGLKPMEKIMDVSSHLVVNTNSMVTKHESVMKLVDMLESAISN